MWHYLLKFRVLAVDQYILEGLEKGWTYILNVGKKRSWWYIQKANFNSFIMNGVSSCMRRIDERGVCGRGGDRERGRRPVMSPSGAREIDNVVTGEALMSYVKYFLLYSTELIVLWLLSSCDTISQHFIFPTLILLRNVP